MKKQTKKIHEPYARFKGWLRENNLTYADIAVLLGRTPATISQKINGQSDFYISEKKKIEQAYGASDEIFSS